MKQGKFDLSKYKPCECENALNWYNTQPDHITAWENCPRGDWMLWIASKLEVNIHVLTLAKAYCAKTVIHLMKDERSINAIKVAIKFGRYKVNKEVLKDATRAAYSRTAYVVARDAYAAAYAAAAYAAADAYAADARVAYDAARAACAAKIKNQLETANICRKYLTKAVMAKIKI